MHDAVFEDAGIVHLQLVVPHKLIGLSVSDRYPIAHLFLGVGAGALFLRLEGFVEAGLVDAQALFFGDELGQVFREAVGVVQLKHIGAADHAFGRLNAFHATQAVFEGVEEGLLLPLDNARHKARLGFELGEYVCEGIRQQGDQAK